MHFVVTVWSKTPKKTARITFKSRLIAQSAIVSCLPVIRQINQDHNVLPVLSAVCVDKNGDLIKTGQITLRLAFPDGFTISMTEVNGIWSAEIPDIKVGNHKVSIESNNKSILKSQQVIRITDGNFTKYNKHNRTISKWEKVLNPLSGSYQGAFYFQGNRSENENMINGQAEWDARDKNDEHLHWWESLTEKELSKRFSYLT